MSITIIAILMFIVLIVCFFLGHPLAFVLGGVGTLFGLFLTGPSFFHAFIDRIFAGTMSNFTLAAIVLFIFMGNLLTVSGIADRLFASLRYLLGSLRGGLGLAVLFVSIIFAACTGIVGASVVTMGLLAGPMLLRYGYQKGLSMGIITAGGTVGLMIPPSIMLVIMGDQANVAVGKLFAAVIIPGLAMSLAYMLYVAIRCTINPKVGPPIPAEQLAKVSFGRRVFTAIIYALPPICLILFVLFSIFLGYFTPAEAAGIGSFLAIILVLVYRRFTWAGFLTTIYQTAKASAMVLMIIVGASCFTSVFIGMGGGTALVEAVMATGLGKWGIYTLMMIILLIMGCFIDWVGLVLIAFPVFLPIAKLLGFDMLWYVTMMAMVLQIAFLTPPFGYALFYMAGLKFEGVTFPHLYRGVLPFVIMQVIGFVILTIYPEIVLWLPSIMFDK